MVHPNVSARTAGAGGGWWRLVEVVEDGGAVGAGVGVAVGGEAGGGAMSASRARASSAHPPTASPATISATSATRGPRRGVSSTGISGSGDPRALPFDGNHR